MKRIDTSTKSVDKFGAGKHGFTNGNPATPIPATQLDEGWFDHVQEEIANVIEGVGDTLDAGDRTQLRQAIQAMIVGAQTAVIVSGVTFEASVADGEAVRWDSGNSRFDEAIADGTANNRAVGIADVTNSRVYLYGECPLFSGLTPGSRYYLDASTAGAITDTAPTDAVKVGVAKSATVLWVDIDHAAAADLQHGQCYLEKNGANLLLKPVDGNKLIINGASHTIPSAGVTLAAAGLTPGTTYFIYAYLSGGTMTLEASATGHSTDATTGVEIKTGDASRTLVGQAYCAAGPAWVDSSTTIGVLSWFNRKPKVGRAYFTTARTTSSLNVGVEVNSEIRVSFLVWADSGFSCRLEGGTFNSTTASGVTYVGVDGVGSTECGGSQYGNATAPFSADYKSTAAEGALHYTTLAGMVLAASTQTWNGHASQSGGARSSNQTIVMG